MTTDSLKDLSILSDQELQEYEDQVAIDASRFDILQNAIKVCLNSCYGTVGSEYFRYFDIRQAEAVTLSGQFAIRYLERRMNWYLNNLLKTEGVDYVIASDTDSLYIRFSDLARRAFGDKYDTTPKKEIVDFLDKVCVQKIQPFIDKTCEELALKTNARSNKMSMKREAIANRGIWVAKKHYILNVYNNEGVAYEKPKLKMTGIDAVKSSTPTVCREKIKKGIDMILNSSERDVQKFIADFKKEFMNLPPEDISFPRGVNKLGDYAEKSATVVGDCFKKGTPINSKGSLIYNFLLKEYQLDKKYPYIYEGDKIKYAYVKENNPLGITVIAFPNSLPKEFDLHERIDYNMQFEKTFLEPLRGILDVIGWKAEHIHTLKGFFKPKQKQQ